MKVGIRLKLFALGVVIIALSLALAHGYASGELRDNLVTRTREDLRVRATLLAGALAEDPRGSLQARVGELARRAEVRITVVDATGRVAADSDVDEAALASVENHADRPEVRKALAHGTGEDTRASHTVGKPMMYVAVLRPEHPGAVVRVARALDDVEHALAPLRRALFAGALIGLLVAVLMSSLVAQWAGRRALALTRAADAMAAGHLEARVPDEGEDEFVSVGRALNTLARNLSETVAALRGERDLLDEVLTGMQEGVLLVSPDGRVAVFNAALRQMLLLPPDARGRPVDDVVAPGALRDALHAMQRRDGPHEVEVVLEGLQPRRLQVRGAAITGSTPGLLVVCVDVTELRRLEGMRRDFVANASHELRTPVASVRAATEMLRDAIEHDRVAAGKFAGIIERNAERLHRLVSDLLDLSRIESQQYRLTPEAVDVGAAVAQVLALVRPRAEERGLQLHVQDDAAPRAARADRRALEQVLVNLVDNVLQHCPPGTRLRVRTAVEQDRVVTTVEDNGPGMEAAHLPRLFERFYRVDAGRSREAGGTGLGLSIVRHLVEEMGGTVSVASTPGEGTRFVVSLPAA